MMAQLGAASRRKFLPRNVLIVGGARTPMGCFLSAFKSIPAHVLGSVAISGALRRAGLEPEQAEQVVVGQVLPAGCGQAPHRQASLLAGIPSRVDVCGVNKVCASGLKALCVAANAVALQQCNTAVAAGMESMSSVPYLLHKLRSGGQRLGHAEVKDGLLLDGLWDPYNNVHMGLCTERVAQRECISRTEQDTYAVESYKRAAHAWKSKLMEQEGIECVSIPSSEKSPSSLLLHQGAEEQLVSEDEEFHKIKLDKVAALKPTFKKEGTITAANSSKLSDGAAAAVLMAEEHVVALDLQPLARHAKHAFSSSSSPTFAKKGFCIPLLSSQTVEAPAGENVRSIVSFADAAVAPAEFPLAPELAIRKALHLAGLPTADFYEINEAFAAVVLMNARRLGVDLSRVNVHGGAISLGHPLGASGLRIVLSLINVLRCRNARYGCAAICNGGGGATALVLERL